MYISILTQIPEVKRNVTNWSSLALSCPSMGENYRTINKPWPRRRTVHRKTGEEFWKPWCLRSSKPPGFWSLWFSVPFIVTVWLSFNCWGNMGLSNHGLCGSGWLNLTRLVLTQLRFKAGQWAKNSSTDKRVSVVPKRQNSSVRPF